MSENSELLTNLVTDYHYSISNTVLLLIKRCGIFTGKHVVMD
jgi:hypothetical protein